MTLLNQHPNISIILVQPHNPGNIGAVARTMMNFGFNDLRLVLPQCDPLHKESKDRARVASPLVENAKLFMTVSQAIADCQIIWGTSGKLRGASPDELSPSQAVEKILQLPPDLKLALVFGPEDRGLNNEELKPCDAMITIPTRDEFPSLNLSHAVTVILYEIAKATHTDVAASTPTLASSQIREGFYNHLKETLTEINFLDPLNPERIMRDMRNIFGRAHLDEREITILRGICRQVLNFRKRDGEK
ncbi:MAG: hypothetical protein ACD_73C00566G0002 [uncultured bacterium]|nr:MAG: hypothetical protein ACD_73C00566G0002 [uncultured bacterium]